MLIGSANVEELAARGPTLESFDAEALALEHTLVVQVGYEIATPHRESMLPPALHPTDPPLVTWLFYRCPASPWGSFAVAQTRIECRSGLRVRGFLVSAVTDNAAAATALAARWGYATRVGRIELHRHYDSLDAAVEIDGRTILDLTVSDPDPLAPADVQYVANMNLARTPRGVRLVQVEARYNVERVERGRPTVRRFDGAAWGEPRLEPVYPVAGSVAVATVTLPRLRFVCRPDVLAFEGTEPAT